MPSTFASGKRTVKFDTPTSLPDAIDSLLAGQDDIYTRLQSLESTVQQQDLMIQEVNILLASYRSRLKYAEKMLQSTTSLMQYVDTEYVTLSEYARIHDRFLKSKLMRFLNIFGGWYTISPGHEKIDKTPLPPITTRIKRWFSTKFLKRNINR